MERIAQQYGLLVLPTNRGSFERVDLDFVMELGVNAGCQVTDCFRVYVGYTLLTWFSPIRPGDQIDAINPSQIAAGVLVGPARPEVPFEDDYFWAQGFNVGAELRW